MNKKQMIKEQKRIKQEKKDVQVLFKDDKDVYKVFYIALGVILFIGFAFAFMNIANGNWNIFNSKNVQKEEIDDKMVMVGTMFNRSEEEYYVLAYDFSSDDSDLYNYVVSSYYGKDIYKLDLSSGFNSKFIGEKEVMSNDLEKLKFANPVLLLIKGDKILKSYVGDDIEKELK